MSVRIEIDNMGFDRFFFSPSGPVMRDAIKRGERIERLSYGNANGRFIRRDTGRLLDGLHTAPVFRGPDSYVEVGTPANSSMPGERRDGSLREASGDYFAYPSFHDKNATGGGRWLTQAILDAGFKPGS